MNILKYFEVNFLLFIFNYIYSKIIYSICYIKLLAYFLKII